MAKETLKQTNAVDLPAPVLPAVVEAVGTTLAPTYETAAAEYDVTQHNIFSETFRPKKRVKRVQKDADGNPILSKDGKPQYKTERIEVNRIGIPLQSLIVKRRVSFMNVGKMQLEANPVDDAEKKLYAMVKKIRDDNKLEFLEKEIARRMLSELQVAKLWYSEPVDPLYWTSIGAKGNFRMRCKVISPKLGDKLLPVFDDYGNMIYFGRVYESKRSLAEITGESDASTLAQIATTKEKRFDIYSDKMIYKFRQERTGEKSESGDGWIMESAAPHSYGKIPVIYYSKPEPVWAEVQASISRIETLVSNFGDTNDYHASPVFVMTGNVGAQFLEKGEQGKSLQIKGEKGDAKYVTWEQATEAVKLELDTLVNFIFTCTQTPQMSMEDLKGLGAASGVAYDRIFMDAHLAAQDEIDGEYGQSTQRDINLNKSFCAAIDTSLIKAAQSLSIKFDIPLFRINDDSETVALLQKASGGAKLLSQKTAIEYSPLTKNAEEEMAEIKKDEAEKAALEATKVKEPVIV